ncbi:hypothetical protein IR010_05310 [Flavobacterium sp. MR2016-29]|uniref:hypothetical protein n=1 Tax=Flavobacterium sp. MR2016-29 TaxID=2783795 RepID=UPI00188D88CB|nr:hypothetical protein [Flavobacterium sp. MR2016-29]MBF4491953.1 hypothetical protein [Flavobacterium sp. MR2016-29]
MRNGTIPILVIISILLFLIYNSKNEYYKKSKEFHEKTLNGEILEIAKSRGTKIYYDRNDFFYQSDYEGPELFVGDVIRKNGSEIMILRKDSKGDYIEVGKGKSVEPEKSYFNYFFGI